MKARATRRVSGPRPAMNPPETPSPSADPAASTPTSNPTPNPTWGILWMLLTMFGFVSMDAMAKHLSQDYSTVQIVWARFTFHAVFLAAWLGARFWHQLKTHRIGLQLGRSLVLMTTTATYFGALAFIPLADASAIMMLSPIIVTALSAPLLGEQVGPRRWAGVCVGCVGALLIVRPGGDLMHWAALLALTGAMSNALYNLMTKVLTRTEPLMTTLVYSATVGAAASALAVPFFWTTPDLMGWIKLAGLGVMGGVSHYCLIAAFTHAPAATVAPFLYTNLIWAGLYGYFLFDHLPDRWTVIGAAGIVGAGLYIFHRERRVKGS